MAWTYGTNILDNLKRTKHDIYRDDIPQLKDVINRVYWEFLRIAPWSFSIATTNGLINVLEEETGTATATKASTSVGLTDAVTDDLGGYKFIFDYKRVTYRISTHDYDSTGKAVVLDAAYKETTISSAAAFTAFQDEYSLESACLKPWRFWFRDKPEKDIHFLDRPELGVLIGTSRVSIGTIPGNKIRLSGEPTSLFEDPRTIEYEYTKEQAALDFGGSTTDTPILPAEIRYILEDMAILQLANENDKFQVNRIIKLRNSVDKDIMQFKKWYVPVSPYFRNDFYV